MEQKTKTDWEGIEREYRAGQLSVVEIGRQFGISHTAINKRAKRDGWTRDLTEKVRKEANARLVSAKVSTLNVRETIDTAANRVFELVTGHRKDLSQLNSLKRILATRLAAYLSGEEPGGPFMSDKESPADVLEKLARTTARLIPLERQAFNLDSDLPEEPATKRTVTEAVAKLDKAQRDSLRNLARALTE
jgi:hypothetical protein